MAASKKREKALRRESRADIAQRALPPLGQIWPNGRRRSAETRFARIILPDGNQHEEKNRRIEHQLFPPSEHWIWLTSQKLFSPTRKDLQTRFVIGLKRTGLATS